MYYSLLGAIKDFLGASCKHFVRCAFTSAVFWCLSSRRNPWFNHIVASLTQLIWVWSDSLSPQLTQSLIKATILSAQ